jgi:hypothetical protein
MKRTVRGLDDAQRYERWGFDDPAPVAPKAREDLIPPKAREQFITPMPREKSPPRAPPLRPSNPAASPWRKIQIPDEERQRAARAGLDRYVGKPANGGTAARFAPPRQEIPPVAPSEPAHDPAEEDDALARAAATRMRHMRRPEAPRAMPPPAQGNPHLGLTVGIIVAVSLMAAIGLSWVAAPAIDAAPPQRADLLQRFSPQREVAEQPAKQSPPAPSDAFIEVAPNMSARPAPTSAVQPIEVAP